MMELRNGRRTDGPAGEPPDARGVFETLLLREGKPVFFKEHVERFAAGCLHFGLSRAPDAATLAMAASNLAGQAGLTEGILRWAAWTTDAAGEEWSLRLEPSRPHLQMPSWRVATSSLRLPEPESKAAAKHLGRRQWREALAAGRADGFDEVLLADAAGHVVEGAISNVFFIRGGRVFTPALASGPLPGIVRAKVLELARDEGEAIQEVACTLVEVAAAAEVFLTNSLVGLRPVAALDGRPLPAPGPVTLRLREAWSRRYGWI